MSDTDNPYPEGSRAHRAWLIGLVPLSGRQGLYWWVRDADETGMSGQGRVAQVAVFEDGSAVLRWLANRNTAGTSSTVFYDSIVDLVWVHGHGEKRTGHLESVLSKSLGERL